MQRVALATYVTIVNRYRAARDSVDERGLTTTEVAVLTFILVAIATAIGLLLYNFSVEKVGEIENNNDPRSVNPVDGE